jgi:hypothetical protein
LRTALDSFHHCPGSGSTLNKIGSTLPAQKSVPKSHAFKIFTYKIFVMKILRGISAIVVGKLLIPDILKKKEGG